MAGPKLRAVFDDFWNWRMSETPEFAYFCGWKGDAHKGKLESYKLEAFEARKVACEKFVKRVEELESELSDPDDKLNAEIFVADLKDYVIGSQYKGYVFPINYMEGIQHELFMITGEWMVLKDVKDYECLVATYKDAVPRQVDELIELMRFGVREKMTSHAESQKGVVDQFDSVLGKPLSDQPLLAPTLKFPDGIGEEDRVRLKRELTQAVEVSVLPALKKLRDFLADEYSKHLRPEIASSSLPQGVDFYQQCLRFHTSTDLTPKQIHQMGLDEVDKIETEMREIIKEVGSEDDIQAFMEKLRTDQSFYCKSAEELLERFRVLCDTIEPMLTKLFHAAPKMKLAIKPHPPEKASGPAAEYLAGTPDGSRPGVFYANTNNYSSQPTYELIPLALHEGNPGHHLQSCYLMEKGGVPDFRQFLEDRKYCDPPSRFPFHTAYIEGWALYTETLGHDLGLYKDPYDRFGHLTEDIFRACRLVVDTGMHALGWTKDQAIQFMLDHSAASRGNIEKEVRRYITWPGQACAYKVGQLKFLELRKRAEDALGADFDIRDFHDVVLRRYGPMRLVERGVDEYIKSKKQQQS